MASRALIRDRFRLWVHDSARRERAELRRQAAHAAGRCPYCGGRKHADRPTCRACDDLPDAEPS